MQLSQKDCAEPASLTGGAGARPVGSDRRDGASPAARPALLTVSWKQFGSGLERQLIPEYRADTALFVLMYCCSVTHGYLEFEAGSDGSRRLNRTFRQT